VQTNGQSRSDWQELFVDAGFKLLKAVTIAAVFLMKQSLLAMLEAGRKEGRKGGNEEGERKEGGREGGEPLGAEGIYLTRKSLSMVLGWRAGNK
jgi:hypothetical protein